MFRLSPFSSLAMFLYEFCVSKVLKWTKMYSVSIVLFVCVIFLGNFDPKNTQERTQRIVEIVDIP